MEALYAAWSIATRGNRNLMKEAGKKEGRLRLIQYFNFEMEFFPSFSRPPWFWAVRAKTYYFYAISRASIDK